jgi:signal transduction histidine kinase
LAIPFAGLAPDERSARGSGELTALDLPAAFALGRELRRRTGNARTTVEVAEASVDVLNSFDHDDRPACVLVRAFVTDRVGNLPGDLQQQLLENAAGPVTSEKACLRLLATRGIEPAWNDVSRSVNHRALLVDAGGSPMAAEISQQLRRGDPTGPTASAFLIADPAGSPAIAAKEFITSYDVRSVFGFGATAFRDLTLVLVAFCRASIDRRTTRLFDLVARQARLAWIATGEMRELIGDGYARVHAAALEEMVVAQEAFIADAFAQGRRELDETLRETRRAAKEGAAAAEKQASHLQRSQRAMLNLIEDLREARESLAATVEVRTRELATANRQLESRNRELEEFAYIASHDLQEPLRTVAGYLQMVERRYGGGLAQEAAEFIRFAIEGAQRMQALIESLLLYSRVTSSDKAFEEFPLEEAVAIAMRNLALRIEETKATVERTEELPAIRGDRIQMVQVFQNLLSNAIKFSGPKPPRIHIGVSSADGLHTIAVRDEGLGFNPRFAERIFKIFRRLRRDTPGTGIGLAVCKKIVERHGGTITADAKPGEGATFTIKLPAVPGGRI